MTDSPKFRTTALAATALIAGLGLTAACSTADDADVVSENISKAADNFEVMRRIVQYNSITGDYILSVEGLCNIGVDEAESQLEVTCKVSGGKKPQYKKHFMGLSDNVTYFAEQGEAVSVSANHYRVTFKPQAILPDVDFRGSSEDTPASDKGDGQ